MPDLTEVFDTTPAEVRTGHYLHSHGNATTPLCIVGKRTEKSGAIRLTLSTFRGIRYETLDPAETISVSRFADPHNEWGSRG